MTTEILQPFQLAADGGIAVTSDPNKQTRQHLKSLISTSPTERVMLPTYGVPVKGAVFLPGSRVVQTQLSQQVSTALRTWEPNINVVGVNVEPNADPMDDMAVVDVQWQPNQIQTGSSSGVQQATILVGGTVVQNGLVV